VSHEQIDKPMAEIIKALSKAIAETRSVAKSSRNTQQGYDFASSEAIVDAGRLPLATNGLAIVYDPAEVRQLESLTTRSGATMARWLVSMRITVWHESGQSLPTVTYACEGSDSGDKAILKAITVCQREHLRQLLLIPRGAFDPEVDEEPKPQPKKVEPKRDEKHTLEVDPKPKTFVEELHELAAAVQTESAKAGVTRSTQSILEEIAKRGRALAGVEGKRQFGIEFAVQAAGEMVDELLKEVG